MKHFTWLVSFCLALLAGSAYANDPLPRARPESVGLSPDRLERIGQVLRADIERGRLPGAVIAIARKGRLVYYESFGYLDKTAGTPMPKDAIFAIASMTKPMIGVGVMQLVEESRIAMSDPASKWIPALGKLPVAALKTDSAGQMILETVPAKREMLIHDLLRHTSGFTYAGQGSTPVHKMYPLNSLALGASLTGPEFIERIPKLVLMHQPGAAWEYGISVDVLGLIIESESGQTLNAFLQERLWKPLGMVDTGFVVPPEKATRYAKALSNDPDTGNPQIVVPRPFKMECGGGCAASTAADYLRFAQMLLNRGKLDKARILGSKTVDYMTADHLGPGIANNIERADPTRAGYGFGLTMAVRPAIGGPNIIGSAGDYNWSGSRGTYFWVDPKEQLAVVFMAQTPGPLRWHYRRVISSLVYQAIVD